MIVCSVSVERQRGSTADMLFPIPKLIEYISSLFRLDEGE
jgi:2-keto-4-pentenoate hydratase/2-oxohepta-3-ene-1,7-dioic acid hydratase in catechol pathway